MLKSKKIKVGIVGAGFTGLATGYYLSKRGFDVSIFEAGKNPGGLAIGFKRKSWKWTLEEHYHHLFLTDKSILKLAKEVGHEILIKRPKTSSFYKDDISQIDSPMSLLKFRHISIISRIRTGIVIFVLKVSPFLNLFEKVEAYKFVKRTMGNESWKVIWGPLLTKKFGRNAKVIPASWFWARIKTRTSKLAYPKGGFLKLAEKIVSRISKNGGKVYFGYNVLEIKSSKKGKFIVTTNKGDYEMDKVVCTLPSYLLSKIIKGLPKSYFNNMLKRRGLGAINLVLCLKESYFMDDTYWLNINDYEPPFLCIVEHTNFMNGKNYNGEKIVYVGKYLEKDDPLFSKSSDEVLEIYLPYLKKISPKFSKKKIKAKYLHKAVFAQPVITKNYSKKVLPLETPIKGLYIANIEQVYPWDRGTNYAVQLGEAVSHLV